MPPKNNIKTYNTTLKKSICLSKKSYYELLFQNFQNDIKDRWKTINEILIRTKRKGSSDSSFLDGEHITDLSIITNKFNNCFINIGTNLSNQIKMLKKIKKNIM